MTNPNHNEYFGLVDAQQITQLKHIEENYRTKRDERRELKARKREAKKLDVRARVEMGLALLEAKSLIPHDGQWGAWLADQDASPRSSRLYIAVAREWKNFGNVAEIAGLDPDKLLDRFISWNFLNSYLGELQISITRDDDDPEPSEWWRQKLRDTHPCPITQKVLDGWWDDRVAYEREQELDHYTSGWDEYGQEPQSVADEVFDEPSVTESAGTNNDTPQDDAQGSAEAGHLPRDLDTDDANAGLSSYFVEMYELAQQINQMAEDLSALTLRLSTHEDPGIVSRPALRGLNESVSGFKMRVHNWEEVSRKLLEARR